jgi:hypothetical protein
MPRDQAPSVVSVNPTAVARRRVLISDDDELSRRMLSDAFMASGLEPLVAADGHRGIHRVIDELLASTSSSRTCACPGSMASRSFTR